VPQVQKYAYPFDGAPVGTTAQNMQNTILKTYAIYNCNLVILKGCPLFLQDILYTDINSEFTIAQ